jgi:hypothetical protein
MKDIYSFVAFLANCATVIGIVADGCMRSPKLNG